MSTKDQTSRGSGGEATEELPDVRQEQIEFQVLQGLRRIESRLDEIEGRLAGVKGTRAVRVEKPNLRNWLNAQLTKGWISETDILEKTGWQTIGVRSFITKARTLGLSVETEERDGVPYYRFAR